MIKSNFLNNFQNLTIGVFLGWLIFSPTPQENSTKQLKEDFSLKVRGGGQEERINQPRTSGLSPQYQSTNKPKTIPNVKPEAKKLPGEKVDFKFMPHNDNGGGGGDDSSGIGTQDWEKSISSNPDEQITNIDFWNQLQGSKKSSKMDMDDDDAFWLFDSEDDMDDDFWLNSDIIETNQSPKDHRKLLAVQNPNPIPISTGKSVPTWKLDQEVKKRFDFTSPDKKVQPFSFKSKDNIQLSADHRSLAKIVYGHPDDLELSDLGSRIPCPIQDDPTKTQRTFCWAITDQNIVEAKGKLLEFTTVNNPDILGVEMQVPGFPERRATFYINRLEGTEMAGSAFVFQKGGKQDGKLWTVTKFDLEKELPALLEKPGVIFLSPTQADEL